MKKQNKKIKDKKPILSENKSFVYPSYFPYAIIAFLILAFYAPLLLGKYWAWDDAVDQHFPNIAFAVSQLKLGVFPWWNPYCFGGMSFAGDMQTCLFYPFQWILFLPQVLFGFSFLWSEWYVVLHLVWMGIGQYILLRDFSFGRKASILASTGLILSGHVTGHYFHFIIIWVIAWTPWAFLFFRRALITRKWQNVFLSALCLGLSMLGGFAQYSVHFFYFLGLYGVYHIIKEKEYLSKKIFSTLIRMAPVFILAAGMALVQYLLTLETAAYSPRSVMTYTFSSESSMWPGQLISIFVPNFYGDVTGLSRGASAFWGEVGTWMHWEAQIYVGIIFLVFSVVGFCKWESKERYLFLGVAVFVLLAALANTFPVYKLLYQFIPGFSKFRGPCRTLFYIPFCLSFLTAAGVQGFFAADLSFRTKIFKVLGAGAGIMVLLWLLFSAGFFKTSSPSFTNTQIYDALISEWGVQALVFVLIAVFFVVTAKNPMKTSTFTLLLLLFWIDLYRAHGRFNLSDTSAEGLYPANQAVQFFKQKGKEEIFRLNARINRSMLLNKNQGMVNELFTLQGNNQMRPQKLVDMENRVSLERTWELYNVKYGIACDSAGQCGWTERAVYKPRFYFADSCEVIEDTSKILPRLAEKDFPYLSKVILNQPIPNFQFEPADTLKDRIKKEKYTSNNILLSVECGGPRLLIASEHVFPAWKVKVDGKKQTIYPADQTFWAVPLSGGSHKVEFYFSSDAFHKGGLVSLISWIVVLAGILVTRKKSEGLTSSY